MWQKLGLAFLAGGLAVGTVVYLGLKDRAPREAPAQTAAFAPAPTPPAPTVEAREVQPPKAEEDVRPEVEKRAAAVRPARAAAKRQDRGAAARRAESGKPADAPVQTAQASRPAGDVIVVPPPVPAPPPAVQQETPKPAAPEVPPAEKAATAKPQPPKREPRRVTIPAGTLIAVRLRDRLSTEQHSLHDPFFATLDAPLIVEGLVIAEKGAMVRGRIVEAVQAGRVKGRAALALQLDELTTSDGQKIEIKTDAFRHEAESGVKGDVAKAGVAAGIGAAIGAIAGGGRGAAIGAAIGGAAGAGGAMATRGKPAELPSETRLTFRLSEPVTVTERLN